MRRDGPRGMLVVVVVAVVVVAVAAAAAARTMGDDSTTKCGRGKPQEANVPGSVGTARGRI